MRPEREMTILLDVDDELGKPSMRGGSESLGGLTDVQGNPGREGQ
jgi:hypothetical protein